MLLRSGRRIVGSDTWTDFRLSPEVLISTRVSGSYRRPHSRGSVERSPSPPVTPDTLAFARSALDGLRASPRSLPCRYLYDARGSELFEQITELPEYYPTRTEAGILEAVAAEIVEATGPVTMIELGSGSSVKTELLLSAYTAGDRALTYVPVDVSGAALEGARVRIEADHPTVSVRPLEGSYHEAFPRFRRYAPSLVVFLGSTIGNFDDAESAEFWEDVEAHLAPGDFFLLGVDLVKDPAVIDAAYNDAAGVTAAFTLNVFARMNRELDAGIDLDGIEHEARYDAATRRVEIFARFTRAQDVHIGPAGETVRIEAGERVLVEISRKFVVEDLERSLAAHGLATRAVFTDPQQWFAVLLLQKE